MPPPATPAYPPAPKDAAGRPNAYQGVDRLPVNDARWITHYQSPNRPPFPYGRDSKALVGVGKAMGAPSPAVDALDDQFHATDFRADVKAASRAQGYPYRGDTPTAPAPASPWMVNAVNRSYPGRMPPVTHTPGQGSAFSQQDGISLGDPGVVTHGAVGEVRHEAQHALERPVLQADPPPGSAPEPFAEWSRRRQENLDAMDDMIAAAPVAEIPAGLADATWMAADHAAVVGKPLDYRFAFPNGKPGDLAWMARQGQQHGLFDGASMTQLLATPSGQAYAKSLVRPPPNGDALIGALNLGSSGR